MKIETAKIELRVGAKVKMNELFNEVVGIVLAFSSCQNTSEPIVQLRLSDGFKEWYYAKHIKQILSE